MNFKEAFSSALQNRSHYVEVESFEERFVKIISYLGITVIIYNMSASELHEDFIREKLEYFKYSRPARVVYNFKEKQNKETVPKSFILYMNGLSASFGSIGLRLRIDLEDEQGERKSEYTNKTCDTWSTMEDVAKSLSISYSTTLFFVGYEKDNEEPIYDDSLLVAEIYDQDQRFIFSCIPHPFVPLM